jgi:hypothetical protein
LWVSFRLRGWSDGDEHDDGGYFMVVSAKLVAIFEK